MRHHLVANAFAAFPSADAKIMTQHFNERKIWRCLAVRNRRSLKYQPTRRQLVTSKFVDQARLTHAGLADHRQYLPTATACPFDKFVEDVDFRIASDQGCQPTSSTRLNACARRGSTDKRMGLDGLRNTLRLHRTQGFNLNKAFDLPQR